MIIYSEIFKDLNKHRVQYVIVGGLAYNLLGGFRMTSDLDILVQMTNKNLAKVVMVLKSHGYKVHQPVDPMGIADAKIRREWIDDKNMKAFNFFKDRSLNQVDIIIESPISYEQAKSKVVYVHVDGLKLPVINADQLIKMKKKASRPIDLADIEELKIIKKLRSKE